MCYACDSQFVSVSSLKGWNESHTLPNLRQSKQNVGRSTLEQNIGLYVCEAAGCVEQPPNGIAGIQQQEWIRGKTADIYRTLMAKLDGCGACSQSVSWR